MSYFDDAVRDADLWSAKAELQRLLRAEKRVVLRQKADEWIAKHGHDKHGVAKWLTGETTHD